MSLTQRQATVNPYLHQRLRDTHRQVWLSLLWYLCSFLLGPGAHKSFVVPSKHLFPWRFLVLLPDPQTGKSVVGPRIFALVQELHRCNCSPVCELSAQWLSRGLKVTSARRTYPTSCTSLGCCNQSLCPHGRSVLAHASVGNTHAVLPWSLVGVTAPFPWSWCAQGFVLFTEAPILWPLDAKSQLIRKDLDAGKD